MSGENVIHIDEVIKGRFHERYTVNEEMGCWEWPEDKWNNGYGRIKYKGEHERTHRLSYRIHNGPIPDGLFVCHTCDNRRCVNPSHLFLGTANDNTQDMIRKGRARYVSQKGAMNGNARLTLQEVEEIRQLIAEGMTNKAIAAKYGVTHSMISLIRLGKSWAA